MIRRFCKPKSDGPTRFLFVGNCGPSKGLEQEDVERLFSPFGEVEVEVGDVAKSYVLVTYREAAQAEAAVNHFTETDTSRGFVLRYADVKPPKQNGAPPAFYLEAEQCGVPGLILHKEFITEAEEFQLLEYLQSPDVEWEWHTGRRVVHYGVPFDYATRNIAHSEEVQPFPECVQPIVECIEQCDHVPELDQLTVNSYPLGVGLAAHIDTHSAFTGSIVILSTGSAAIMLFRKGGERSRLLLPRRSLLIMSQEARYCWQHSIPPNRMERESRDRISFTMRQARGFPCTCSYPEYCDSQLGALPPTRLLLQRQQTDEEAEDQHTAERHKTIEEDHVHHVYDVIARHFSATRFAVWPKVREFLGTLERDAILADIGCGNGKYFNVRKDIVVFGIDHSEGLLKAALDRHQPLGSSSAKRSVAEVLVADAMHLPLRDATVDAALCVAVLHHVSTIDRRLQILNEIARILSPGGRALITVWAQEQEDIEKTIAKWQPIQHQDDPNYVQEVMGDLHGSDYLVPWHLPLHRAEGQIAAQDVLNEVENGGTINEEKRSVMFHRYYHLYVKGEIEHLCSRLTSAQIVDAFYDKSNWCVIIQKKSM